MYLRHIPIRWRLLLLMIGIFVCPMLWQPAVCSAATENPVDFVSEIEPIFHTKCYQCHGPDTQMVGLRLDKKVDALKGGYSGAVIVAGDSAQSKLIERVSSNKEGFKMPPADTLTPAEIARLKAWIDQGASWPESTRTPVTSQKPSLAERKAHWSFQPVHRPEPPTVKQGSWVQNPIDSFVLHKLESEGITPSPEADKTTLIRRVTFDLIGLPPSMEEVTAFLSDSSPDAYEKVVNRLLNSPHYGERWARQWLDLARYADSDGFEKDLPRPYAWRWREYVIEALNRDMPFDQFTIEQIAGDLLPKSAVDPKVATGFHRNGLKNREAGVKREEARFEELVDRTNTIGTVWLGMTVGCAQCHDHKYDPFTQKDFYQLYAFMNQTQDQTIDAPLPGELGPFLQHQPEYRKKRAELLAELDVPVLEAQWEANLRQAMDSPGKNLAWDYQVTGIRAMVDSVDLILRRDPDKRTTKENDGLTDYFVKSPGPDIEKDKAQREKFKELQKKLEDLDRSYPALSQAFVISQNPEPVKTFIAIRGDYRRAGIEVQPEIPAIFPAPPRTSAQPRLQFAQWIVSRENPLTGRVTMNRMWQEFFGRGIVRTSDDFGLQGEKPTHPELLDWLAVEFMDRDWSLKQMNKLIVMSATYRQSSHDRPDLREKDPANTLLARQNRLRLSAEGIRDAALFASGLLYPAVGGPSIRPPQPESVTKLTYGNAKWEETTGKDRYRRGLYIHFQRTSPYPQLANFDEPNANNAASQRRRSNTPLQALNLLNDPVFTEAAQSLAMRALQEAPSDWNGRLDTVYEFCLNRKPNSIERDRLARFYWDQRRLFETTPDAIKILAPNPIAGSDPVDVAAWVGLGRVVMNLDEFITRGSMSMDFRHFKQLNHEEISCNGVPGESGSWLWLQFIDRRRP
ncbi:MAG: PSD1 and planctomycete cytochrome C domain-containing protein [Terriglobia bacterium]